MTYRTLTVFFTLALLTGCGSGDATNKGLDLGSVDANQIGELIDAINEAKGNPKRLATIFAAGTKAPDAKKLNAYDYSLGGKPSVNGDTATCSVRIDHSQSGETSQKEWTFVKQSDGWKIKDAPLP
jgi:hypothetical protein